MGVSLCKANSLLQPAQCPYRPVPGHRSSPITSTAPRESHNREEAELLTSVAEVTAVPCVSIPEATASLSRPGVQGPLLFIQAAARVRQPTVEYHLLALQAASTRYRETVSNLPAANEPACMLYCKQDLIGLLGAASFKA